MPPPRDRDWYRDRAIARRRAADEGFPQLVADLDRILRSFRDKNGWQPGWQWNPHAGAYEPPGEITQAVTATVRSQQREGGMLR